MYYFQFSPIICLLFVTLSVVESFGCADELFPELVAELETVPDGAAAPVLLDDILRKERSVPWAP